MSNKTDPVFSRNVVEFTAAAVEFCKYAEHAGEIKGDELLKILQRILPYLYLKASLLPSLEPYFEDGNEKYANYFIRSIVAPKMSNTYIETKIIHLLKLPIPYGLFNSEKLIEKVDEILLLRKTEPTCNTNLIENEIDNIICK
jgi:hypothetical protein